MFKERCGNADLFFEANKKRLPTLAKIIHYPAGIINASSFFRFPKFRPAAKKSVPASVRERLLRKVFGED